MTKVTADLDDVPRFVSGSGARRRDYTFTPQNLRLVAATIATLTGHSIESLMCTPKLRIERTATWALGSVARAYGNDEALVAAGNDFMEQLRKVKEARKAKAAEKKNLVKGSSKKD